VLDVLPVSSNLEIIKLRRVSAQVSVLNYVACHNAGDTNTRTKSNIEEHFEGIKILHLPQGIRDAIVVTRKLDLQYLSVDSLCIVQDSEEDKIHEIGRMESTYGNAWVTISARLVGSPYFGNIHIPYVFRERKMRLSIDSLLN
jgi:hypothetical protein